MTGKMARVSISREDYVGDVLFRVTGDVVFLRPAGVFSLELAQHLIQLTEQVLAQYGYSFILADLQKAGPIPPDVRRLLAQFAAYKPLLAVAFYHVSPFIRGMNALLFGAMSLFNKKPHNMRQFSTEESAVRWLNAERKRLLPQSDP